MTNVQDAMAKGGVASGVTNTHARLCVVVEDDQSPP